ncbi:hypothetical protein HN481_05195 [Candidatus Parcubacteria bacterium]|jgi:hypothetical protein|nr:hypothetical protein [Candidatus Parcubacteria bacterium]
MEELNEAMHHLMTAIRNIEGTEFAGVAEVRIEMSTSSEGRVIARTHGQAAPKTYSGIVRVADGMALTRMTQTS